MADLHPEVLALIEAGPQQVAIGKDGIGVESYAMFARRIALRQQELEREECANECAAEFVGNDGETLGDEDEAYNQAIRDCISAIRRRGEAVSDYMCPNCVTPWKCNGPHIPEAVSDRPIHEVLAEISAKVPPEEWAKLDKTHYADPDTLATLNRLERENADLRAAISKSQDDIEQTLGRALGYPWFKDDQKNFPGATDADGVCVGDHVAESLAMEAASKISDLRARLEAAERKLIATGIWREAPCCICGYNGPGYFQPSKHKCAAIDAAIAQGKGEK